MAGRSYSSFVVDGCVMRWVMDGSTVAACIGIGILLCFSSGREATDDGLVWNGDVGVIL